MAHTPHPKPYWQSKSSTSLSTTTQATSSASPTTSPTTPLLPTPAKPLPFHKLSPEAIQQRRKDGLCFRCPAKYFPGHTCSPPQFLCIVDPGETEQPDHTSLEVSPPPEFNSDPSPPEFMSLSPAAFFGMASPQTLRLTGFIRGKPVSVLIDCGSTHNIMQPRIATALSVPTRPLEPFPVMVGNGQYIHCEGYCHSVAISLQSASFTIPFFLFPIQGADVVLGISWLASLGRIQADFAIPELSFTLAGTTTTLRGNHFTQPVTAGSLSSLLRHDAVASLHTLVIDHTQKHTVHPSPSSTFD